MTAIQNNDVINLLCGDTGYDIPISEFYSASIPTEIDVVLCQCFYEKKGQLKT